MQSLTAFQVRQKLKPRIKCWRIPVSKPFPQQGNIDHQLRKHQPGIGYGLPASLQYSFISSSVDGNPSGSSKLGL